MADLRSLLASADDLRIDALAQDAWCAQPASMSVAQTFDEARALGYDVLPVVQDSGIIRATVATSALEGADSWQAALADARPLTPDRLVAREAPVLRLLSRLEQQRILFTLGRTGVDGVVTIYDVNQPAAHLFAFGVVLVCEADVSAVLRSVLGDDPDHALQVARTVLGPRSPGVRRWKRMRASDDEIHLASTLMFGEKLRVLKTLGLDRLAELHRTSSESLIVELEDICALRNAIAHYDDHLDDPEWTFTRMLLAQRFAERVVGRERAR